MTGTNTAITRAVPAIPAAASIDWVEFSLVAMTEPCGCTNSAGLRIIANAPNVSRVEARKTATTFIC